MKPVILKAALVVPVSLMALIISFSIGCLIAGSSARKEAPVPAELDSVVRAAWTGIGNSESKCGEYDYFPGGGMRNFYCHLINYIGYRGSRS